MWAPKEESTRVRWRIGGWVGSGGGPLDPIDQVEFALERGAVCGIVGTSASDLSDCRKSNASARSG